MPDKTAIQDLYPESVSHCYGCGRLNEHGLQIKSYVEGDETVCHFVPRPYHMAVPGYVYGGLIASLIDCHGTGTAAVGGVRVRGPRAGLRAGDSFRHRVAKGRLPAADAARPGPRTAGQGARGARAQGRHRCPTARRGTGLRHRRGALCSDSGRFRQVADPLGGGEMFTPDLLKDKVILITGGGTGLGRAMGERFLELGAKLAIASRREQVLRQAARRDDGRVRRRSLARRVRRARPGGGRGDDGGRRGSTTAGSTCC